MATPAISSLQTAIPSAVLHALVRPGVSGVLASNSHISQILSLDDRNLSLKNRQELRTAQYDAAVLFPNSLSAAWLAFTLRIPLRIGYARGGRSLLLTDRLKYRAREWQTYTPKPLTNKSILGPRDVPGAPVPHHMTKYYNQIAERAIMILGGRVAPVDQQTDLELPVAPETASLIETLLDSRGLSGARLVGINPGAAYGGAKRWPPERLGIVADALSALGYEIISTASKNEAALTDEVQHHASIPIHPLGEEVDLQGLVALIDRLSLLITNDSGAMHIAAARRVPTISIFGPTDWNVTYPQQDKAIIVRKSPDCAPCFLRECPIDHRCMQQIDTRSVIAEATRLLESIAAL